MDTDRHEDLLRLSGWSFGMITLVTVTTFEIPWTLSLFCGIGWDSRNDLNETQV